MIYMIYNIYFKYIYICNIYYISYIYMIYNEKVMNYLKLMKHKFHSTLDSL